MQLRPRYGTDPLVVLDRPPSAILEPNVRQRRRLLASLAEFGPDEWAHPSRCDGWSNRDVVVHLESAFGFWAISAAQGARGEPTRFLESFDPVASPAAMVDSAAGLSPAEALDRLAASSGALDKVLTSLDDAGWVALAESPLGHVSISAMAHHALWDSWVHERDILFPMAIDAVEEPDEVTACLEYAAALSPAFGVNSDASGRGTLVVDAVRPDVGFAVEIGASVRVRDNIAGDPADLVLRGDAVDLVEALSRRQPLHQDVPDDLRWMVDGLATVFDQV